MLNEQEYKRRTGKRLSRLLLTIDPGVLAHLPDRWEGETAAVDFTDYVRMLMQRVTDHGHNDNSGYCLGCKRALVEMMILRALERGATDDDIDEAEGAAALLLADALSIAMRPGRDGRDSTSKWTRLQTREIR